MSGGIRGTNNAGIISNLMNWELVHQKGVVTMGTRVYPQDFLIKKIMDYRGKPYISKSEFVHELANAADEEKIIVVGLDCATIHDKDNALGWLNAISNQSPQPSVIVLENITELSSPELQDLLIHSWKGETKYLVYLTWDIDKREEFDKIWNPKDNFLRIDNYAEWKTAEKIKYIEMSKEELTKCLQLRGLKN